MPALPKRTALILAVVAACLAAAAPASAARWQETVIQDDPEIVYQDDPVALNRTLATIKSLGIDTVRVSLFWHLVAPDPTSTSRPGFGPYGPSYPGSYPEWRWERYDRVVKLAQRNGLQVLMNPTGPAPRWATPRRYSDVSNYKPSVRDFSDFVKAAGIRYSGLWPDRVVRVPVESDSPGPIDVEITPPGDEPGTRQQVINLPRVNRWSIWNEPNFPNWLLPQWTKTNGRFREVSPHLYRGIVDAGWRALRESTHGRDLILIGETAPYGPGARNKPGFGGLMSPTVLIRELYCLNKRFRVYRGRAARVRGCPETRAQRRAFRSDHPALFEASGWAHHAYSLVNPPTYKGKQRHSVPLGAVRRLTRTLDRAQFRWGAQTDNWPIWITEYGYQTLPPDPIRGVSWERQAAWMSWAEYLMFKNRRVGSFAQFLLVDDKPNRGVSNLRQRWRTWQSGFLTADGEIKPAFREFRYPIHVTPRFAARGRAARVFGAFRVAADGTRLKGVIQFARSGSDDWRDLVAFETTNVRGYVSKRVRPGRSGRLRIVWVHPNTGRRVATRAVGIRRR